MTDMANGVQEKLKREKWQYLVYVLLVVVPITLCLIWMFSTKDMESPGSKSPSTNSKVGHLLKEAYFFFWMDKRPQPKVDPKTFNYIQRIWNYLKH